MRIRLFRGECLYSVDEESVSGHIFEVQVRGSDNEIKSEFIISDANNGGIKITCVSRKTMHIVPTYANQVEIYGE